jgi:GntR family transcriptional regulator of vanillate catabolism
VVTGHAAREQHNRMLAYAHRQHPAIVGALLNGEGARVEALMQEHTHLSKESRKLPAWPGIGPHLIARTA